MSNLNNQFTNAISNLNQINVNVATPVTNTNTVHQANSAFVVTSTSVANVPASTNITSSSVILQTLKRRNTKVVVPLDERVRDFVFVFVMFFFVSLFTVIFENIYNKK